MKFQWNRKYTTIAAYAFLVISASILFIMLLLNMQTVLNFTLSFLDIIKAFIFAFVFAYLLNPGYKFFQKKVYMPLVKKQKWLKPKTAEKLVRIFAIITIYVLVLGVLTFLLWIVVPQIIESVKTLIANFDQYYESFNSWLLEFTRGNTNATTLFNSVNKWVVNYLKNFDMSTLVQIKEFTVSLTSGIAAFFVGIIVSIYMLYNKEKFTAQFRKFGYAVFSKKWVKKLESFFGTSHETFGKYLSGVLVDALLVGTLCAIIMQIAGVPYAILIGTMVGLTNVIPFFGPFIGGIPSALLVLMVKPSMTIWCVVILVALQQVDGNFFNPKIVGQKTGLSAMWVIFAILIGGGIFGVVGMLIGVPVFTVIYIMVRKYINSKLKAKDLPVSTESYYGRKAELEQNDEPDEKS